MPSRVVDTNVALVANGAHLGASPQCQIACIDALSEIVDRGCVFIDVDQEILVEYQRNLHANGQPGVGDLFYRHVLDNQGNASRVRSVDPTARRASPLTDAFLQGDLSDFDLSDRKFALVSAVARAPVLVAIDSDWVDHKAGLEACGVQMSFVCGIAAARRRVRPNV